MNQDDKNDIRVMFDSRIGGLCITHMVLGLCTVVFLAFLMIHLDAISIRLKAIETKLGITKDR